jgi:hypothetical protein
MFGNVKRVTRSVGGREFTFRSLLEYRWAVWCQVRKESGIIEDWWYEDPESVLVLEKPYYQNKKEYWPDFTILYPNGDYEYEETKGYFPAKDYTCLLMVTQQYTNPITLIFAKTPAFQVVGEHIITKAKNSKTIAQIRRAVRLEKHIERVIYNADRDIFKKIRFMFDE